MLSPHPPSALSESEVLAERLCRVLFPPPPRLCVAGASEGERVYPGVEDPARGHCWADRPQYLARRAGSEDLEGMAAISVTWSTCVHQDLGVCSVLHNKNLTHRLKLEENLLALISEEDQAQTGFRPA